MKILEQRAELVTPQPIVDWGLENCAKAARISHQSTPYSDHNEMIAFLKRLIDKGHDSILEHGTLTYFVTTNRITSHQFVRHRFLSVVQESQRYCSYTEPVVCTPKDFILDIELIDRCFKAYEDYPGNNDVSRSYLLPIGATRMWCTANFREWRHILRERFLNPAASKMFRELMQMVWDTAPEVLKYKLE